MKNILITIFVFFSIQAFSQTDTLKAIQAKDFVGKEITIKDVIAGARLFERTDKTTFLINLAEKYPDTPLTIVLYDENAKALTPKEDLDGKIIVVKGIVSVFNDKIQIVVTDLNNIRIK